MILDNMLDLEKYLQEIENAKVIAMDTETVSLSDKTMVGFSYAFLVKGKVKRYYIPVTHTQIKNLAKSKVKKLLHTLTKQLSIVFHNYAFDAQVLFQAGYKLKHTPHDSMIIAHLLDENNSVGLKKLVKRMFKHDMLTFKEVCGVGKKQISFADVIDPVVIEQYAAEDAEYTLKVFLRLYHKLQKDKALSILYEALEHLLLEVTSSMHNHGITVNTKKVKEIEKECKRGQDWYYGVLLKNMQNINLNSSKQLREYFIDKLNMPVIKCSRKTGKPSVDNEVLKVYSTKCKDAEYILKYRYYSKLLSTFIPALSPTNFEKVKKGDKCKGKIYPSFNQAGCSSGRFSSSSPNFQNIPKTKDKLGIRECIIASKGYKLIALDYSNIEMRIIASFSGEEKLIKAFNSGLDIHSKVAKDVGCSRDEAKTLSYALLYGAGAKTIAKHTNTTIEKAEKYVEDYYESYPKIREFILKSKEKAHNQGYTETFMKRKRHINKNFAYLDEYKKAAELRSMVNAIVQGSSADILKAAMVMIHHKIQKYEALIIATIHDEILLECPNKNTKVVEKIAKQCMLQAGIGLKVSLKVEGGIGNNWKECYQKKGVE